MNPADLPSRGCSPSELLRTRWWEGLDWLRQSPSTWPKVQVTEDYNSILAELKKEEITMVACFLDDAVRDYTFAQQVRIMGCVRRFIRNAGKGRKISIERLTGQEIVEAEHAVWKDVQHQSFEEQSLLNGLPTFVCERGLILVKTRLLYRDDFTDFKTPIVLSSKHPLVRKLIMEEHWKHCHAGVNFLLTHLRERYWIIQGRRTVKGVISSCYRCRRYAAKPPVVEEAPLPEDRIKDAEPFEVTGVDLAGPLTLKNGQKTWIVLYTCAVYRAVYLDTVSSLSTQAIINSLSKFVCKHGRPAIIYSDNGTNFVGASNKFKELDWKGLSVKSELRPIQWKFNPPSASWWGGWWERLIRTVKDLLRKTVGKGVVTQAELLDVLNRVAEIMNNRPLTYVSEDPMDLEPLTPAMFLRTPARVVFPEVETVKEKMQVRYRFLNVLKEELKRRFRSEYLAMLVSRPKKLTRPVQLGEIVFIGSEQRKRLDWRLGRILELLPGRDGEARLARVKTEDKVMLIPIQRLHPLELEGNGTLGSMKSKSCHQDDP